MGNDVNEQIHNALRNDRTIDITTYGRLTGLPRRKEMAFFNFDGQIYLTGRPGKRDWYANLVSNPRFIFHLKQSVQADLDASATPITDMEERMAIMHLINDFASQVERDAWLAESPLINVTFEAD